MFNGKTYLFRISVFQTKENLASLLRFRIRIGPHILLIRVLFRLRQHWTCERNKLSTFSGVPAHTTRLFLLLHSPNRTGLDSWACVSGSVFFLIFLFPIMSRPALRSTYPYVKWIKAEGVWSWPLTFIQYIHATLQLHDVMLYHRTTLYNSARIFNDDDMTIIIIITKE